MTERLPPAPASKCAQWHACEQVKGYEDETALTMAIGDVLMTLSATLPVATLAVLVVKIRREEVLQLSGLKGLGMKELWSVPIFLWVGLTCFAFIPLWRAFSGEHHKLEQRLERHPQRAGRGGWSFVEQLAVIMGIISFIIQVAQWVYLWL